MNGDREVRHKHTMQSRKALPAVRQVGLEINNVPVVLRVRHKLILQHLEGGCVGMLAQVLYMQL